MTRFLIAGRSDPAVRSVQERINSDAGLQSDVRVISNGHADPLYGVAELPSVLVLVLLDNSMIELEAFGQRPASARPPLVVVSDALDTETMRQAMRVGAREFLDVSCNTESMVEILERLAAESHHASQTNGDANGQIVAVMNSAGGLGSSMIASNLACLSAKREDWDVAILDLDIQLAPQCNYFDIQPKNNILDAIARVEEMDEFSLDAYATVHDSGLDILSAIPASEIVHIEQYEEGFDEFLGLLRRKYQRVVVDLPRNLDALTVSVLERADAIVLVIQQNLTSIRNASRLLDVLRNDLLVDDENIIQVINRHNKSATLEISDVRRTLMAKEIFTIPNHYRFVAESVDMGVPMADHAPSSSVTRSLRKIEQHLTGDSEQLPRNIIERTFSSLLRS